MKPRYFAKDEILHEQGQVIDKAYFLSSGFMIASYYNDKGDKQIISIYSNDEVISGKSFTGQTPGDYELRVCKDTYVLYLTYNEVKVIYERFPDTQEQAMVILASREKKELVRNRMLNQDAEKKVADFYATFPGLSEPGKIIIDADIASYLLISESSLRAHRAKLARERY
ncbi:Crp/Fnr family transcriptional regulator [Mucilaginibacter sp.]